MRSCVRFGVLGPLQVTVEGRPVPVNGRRQRELLALLSLRANHAVSVGTLIDLCWPDQPPPTARRQIQNCVGRLRRTLFGAGVRREVIQTRPDGYILDVGDDEVDMLVFLRLAGEGRRLAAEERWGEAVARLRGALALWRGSPFAEIDDDLVESEVRGLHEQRLTALTECLELELRRGRHQEVTCELAAFVREHPLHEPMWEQLMLALYRCGRTADALEAYQRARAALVAELGLEPGSRLRALERAILMDDGVLELPARSHWQTDRPKPNLLPADPPDFTGRAGVVARMEGALRPGGGSVAVAVVAGQAGVGKSTLAVHLAHRLRDSFPDGRLYVDLRGGHAHRAGPAEVLARFLGAFGIADHAVSQSIERRAEAYRSLLADRRVLVVLDNAFDEAQVRPLLPGMPGCAVMVTSRSRLAGLAGARRFELDVLHPARALDLLSRIVGEERVAAEIGAAHEIVRLCGRLPLALRIAGARLVARPHRRLTEMAERLADERQRLNELVHGDLAVRTSISLSYEAATGDSRRLFRLLGLLDTADFDGRVCAALLDTTTAKVDELLDELIDARLVEPSGRDAAGHPRYRLQNLVRLYAGERAAAEEPPYDGFMTRL